LSDYIDLYLASLRRMLEFEVEVFRARKLAQNRADSVTGLFVAAKLLESRQLWLRHGHYVVRFSRFIPMRFSRMGRRI